MVLPFIILIIAACAILYIFFTQVNYDENHKIIFNTKGISNRVRQDFQNISWFLILGLVLIYLLMMLIGIIITIIYSVKKNNTTALNYLFIVSLVTLIVVVFR
ncbi:UNVERIFIED_CONTAM: hypothetical protein O8I53_08335 [Campylobacter lari]